MFGGLRCYATNAQNLSSFNLLNVFRRFDTSLRSNRTTPWHSNRPLEQVPNYVSLNIFYKKMSYISRLFVCFLYYFILFQSEIADTFSVKEILPVCLSFFYFCSFPMKLLHPLILTIEIPFIFLPKIKTLDLIR